MVLEIHLLEPAAAYKLSVIIVWQLKMLPYGKQYKPTEFTGLNIELIRTILKL
jgi:hypothetical protein